jgi:hypothetical protein
MKLNFDTNAYVAFKLGYSELVEYLMRADLKVSQLPTFSSSPLIAIPINTTK